VNVYNSRMKFDNVRAFEKHLKEAGPNHFTPVYVLISPEEFEQKEALKSLIDAVGADEVVRFSGDKLALELVMQELGSLSFFSKRRVIVIDKTEKLNKDQLGAFERYFAKPEPSVFLVFAASSVHRGTKFYKDV